MLSNNPTHKQIWKGKEEIKFWFNFISVYLKSSKGSWKDNNFFQNDVNKSLTKKNQLLQ